jgi:fatty-acyl-CoA synthase
MKDVIKSGGEWVSSLALESLASAIDGVVEAAAVGVPDAKWGERPLLLIVVGEGADREAVSAALDAAFEDRIVSGELSKWAMPDEIRFVESLAKTSVGKIDKKTIRAGLG